MMRSIFFIIFLSCVINQNLLACLNEFNINKEGIVNEEYHGLPVFYRSFDTEYAQMYVDLFDLNKKESINYQDLSDLAVQLARLKRFDQSLDLLIWLNQKHPNEYTIVANLGTLYELTGNIDSAYFYIQKGMELNPDSHFGSEWVHLAILKAKMQMRNDKNWIFNHQVLNLNLNYQVEEYSRLVYSIMDTINQISYQMEERIPFTPAHDLILANILNELGQLLETHISVADAYVAYRIAQYYDQSNHFYTRQNFKRVSQIIETFKRQGLMQFDSQVFYKHFPAKQVFRKINRKLLSKYLDMDNSPQKAIAEAVYEEKNKAKNSRASFFIKAFTILFGIVMFGVFLWSRS